MKQLTLQAQTNCLENKRHYYIIMCKTSSELKKQIEDLIEDHKERIEYLNEVTTLIIEYINLKITPYSLSDTGESGVKILSTSSQFINS